MSQTKTRWVVKAGSQMVCLGGPWLIRSWMWQIAQLRQQNIEVIWVTSGAIATGTDRTHFEMSPNQQRTLAQKQALSAIGQPLIMDLYNLSLQSVGLLGAQVLITYDDFYEQNRKQNILNTLEQLLHWQTVPVINENDAVGTDEIKFGDNDSLSAQVAVAMKADRLVLLTDVEGLFDSDPKKNPNAKKLDELSAITAELLQKTSPEQGSTRSTGGMYSKLKALEVAQQNKISGWLAKGDAPNVLLDIAAGKNIGTRILQH